ncbi:MAG: DNA damage-inducible protein D [Burkholderiales bacterium]|nr:DNA damage-inducible protein D [Phycisphaerae bacterium]
MKRETIDQLCGHFERLVQVEQLTGIEFWLARDLQEVLGYDKWENFAKVVERAIISCKTAGYDSADHFLEARKMVELGSGAQRQIADYMLTRYACYLIAQNGDSGKEPIAFAQTYFAIQTRRAELIEKRLVEVERVQARKKLSVSEKELSGLIYERTRNEKSFGLIRSRGDQALFGGKTTHQMKENLGVPDNRPLADFLPTITIKAKDFANEITNFNIHKDDLKSEFKISQEHVKNNQDVRKVLTDRGIIPERLPPADDVKKIERRLASEEKKLPNQSG